MEIRYFPAIFFIALAACGTSSSKTQLMPVGEACERTADCEGGLVCYLQTCHTACTQDADCDELSEHCDQTGHVCMAGSGISCGNAEVEPLEDCDDGNIVAGDGCSPQCGVEAGWTCTQSPSVCETHCGDGTKAGDEECDDGGTVDGDGCSALCTLEAVAGGFVAITNADPSALYRSNTVQIRDIGHDITVSLPATAAGVALVVDGVVLTETSTTLVAGQLLALEMQASTSYNVVASTSVSIDALDLTWDITTKSSPTPTPFTFTAVTDAVPSQSYTSNTVTLAGYTGTAHVSVYGVLAATIVLNGVDTGASSVDAVAGDTLALTGAAPAVAQTSATATIAAGDYLTTWTLSTGAPTCVAGTQIVHYTGAVASFTMPPYCTTLEVLMWGAGGAGSTSYHASYGGAGGYARVVMTATPGQVFDLWVGGGGELAAGSVGGAGGLPAGGAGGTANTTGGGGGGGRSELRTSASLIAVAGGGGGAGGDLATVSGGAGGGSVGQAGGGSQGGQGGTQSAGGAGGGMAEPGSAFAGGNSNTQVTTSRGGGGGGDGYYGGGAGATELYGAGGGGSGYLRSDLTGSTLIGSGPTPPNVSSVDYESGAATGGTMGIAGGDGLIVFHWTN